MAKRGKGIASFDNDRGSQATRKVAIWPICDYSIICKLSFHYWWFYLITIHQSKKKTTSTNPATITLRKSARERNRPGKKRRRTDYCRCSGRRGCLLRPDRSGWWVHTSGGDGFGRSGRLGSPSWRSAFFVVLFFILDFCLKQSRLRERFVF